MISALLIDFKCFFNYLQLCFINIKDIDTGNTYIEVIYIKNFNARDVYIIDNIYVKSFYFRVIYIKNI